MFERKIIFHIVTFLMLFYHFGIQGQSIDVEKEIETILEMSNHDLEKTIKYTDSLLQYNFPDKLKIKLERGILHVYSNKPKKAILIFKSIIHSLTDDEKNLKTLGHTHT